jgi:DNA polymerase-3 subunit gamma/tau
MSYTVLARRYRSSTFDEVVGQEHVAQTLKKAIASDRVAHAYLFNGTRGVGKTSMARILAKALNCLSFDKPTPTPCGTCNSCLAIARGDDIDVIEIDAASNTGVDNVREVIENSQYRPARARFKVYIVDEAHMLSKQAFNALLKTLEEPPSHVKFILATTEPEKILPTILSRCQRYDFRNIPTREIAAHLKEICKSEKIEAEEDALLLVAKAGAGSMRDSLSLLDRLLSVGEKKLTADMIEQLLGLPRSQLLFDLAEAIGNGDVKSTLTQADAMVRSGLSVDGLIATLTDHLRNLLIIRTCGADSELVEVPGLALSDLSAQAERFDPVALTQDIALLEELRRHIRQSQAGRALLDATLVRLAMADQFASIGELLARASGMPATPRAAAPSRSAAPAGEKKKADEPVARQVADSLGSALRTAVATTNESVRGADPTVAIPSPGTPGEGKGGGLLASAQENRPSPQPSPGVPGDGVRQEAARNNPPAPAQIPDDDSDDDLPRPGKVWDGPSLKDLLKQQASAATPPAPAPQQPSSNVEAVDPSNLPGVWKAMLGMLAKHGPGLGGLLSHGQLVAIEDGRAIIRYGEQHASLVKMFDKNGKKEQVRDAITKVLNQQVGVAFEIGPEPAPSAAPAAPEAAPRPRTAAPPSTPAPPPPPAAPAAPPAPSIRITPELVQTIRESEPLIRDLMDKLGAQIVKVE